MPLTSGANFAGFRIVRLLGSGGMGEVYLAEHPRLPRQDALKVLPRDVSADADYRQRFNREADLAATLWHPHIVGVHDRGEFEGQIWISMDFVDGLDAARLLADRYSAGMPPDLALPILSAVASALDHAHKRGLLHRDVKPANIMLAHSADEDEHRILLADFGISRKLDDISGLTATNMTVGTVAYSAPEQLMGESVDGRADQYALAATAYHLLTGSQLFPHTNPAVVISRHLNAPPPALVGSHPGLAALDRVLKSALAKDPADRFHRCGDFARALAGEHAAIGNPSFTVAPTKPAPSPGSPSPDQRKSASPAPTPLAIYGRSRRPLILPVSVVVVIVLLSLTALIWRPWQHISATSAASSAPTPPPSPVVAASSTTRPPPPPPPTMAASAADTVLLTPAEISAATGRKFVGSGSGGAMTVTASSFGTSDHSGVVTPASCVDVVFTAEQTAFGNSGFEAIRDQTLQPDRYSGSGDSVQQTVIVYPNVELAQAEVADELTRWTRCATSDVTMSKGESGYGWNMGSVDRSGELTSLQMYAASNESGASFACQQVLGARDNVVVSARTCLSSIADNAVSPEQFLRLSPSLAGDYGRQVAAAMLNKVRV